MNTPQSGGAGRRNAAWARGRRGSMLLEVSIGLGTAVLLALLLLKGSLVAVSGNQWISMQTLTDAMLTRETALANRIPFAGLTSETSLWPDAAAGFSGEPPTIVLEKLMGGKLASAKLIRFRVNQADPSEPEVNLAVWRLHSILRYKVGEHEYVKSSTTLRVQ